MIVTTTHLFTIRGFNTRPGFCRSKSKAWFKRHGLDWADFVRNGIDDGVLRATGDGLAIALADWAATAEAARGK